MKKAHERSHHGHTGFTRHSPRNGFTAYFVLSPAIGLFCHRHQRSCLRQLDAGVEASGPHDFAVREQDGGSCKSDLPDAESEIFLPAGLDSSKSGRRSDLPVGQIRTNVSMRD
jgi:hypothetical protein